MKPLAADGPVLDRELARYGSETGEIRTRLRQVIASRVDMIWPQCVSAPARLGPIRSGAVSGGEGLASAIRDLKPRDDAQRALQSRALDLTEALLKARWLVLAGTETSVPRPFLVILLFWLTITFASFGLFAPRNGTVLAVLLVCALSVGSAIFLVLEMGSPFDGVVMVSADPLRYAFTHINQ